MILFASNRSHHGHGRTADPIALVNFAFRYRPLGKDPTAIRNTSHTPHQGAEDQASPVHIFSL